MYKNMSIQEQNSLDVAWTVLMDDDFDQLRSCICSNKTELRRFRQLMVNGIMATDISCPELRAARRDRWVRAFNDSQDSTTASSTATNGGGFRASRSRDLLRDSDGKATAVYECVVQAAVYAPAMQHFKTYSKFNMLLFEERFLAYMDGKESYDPGLGWYDNELDFFDATMVPLVTQLRESGVFGAFGLELEGMVLENRSEFCLQGEAMIDRMHASCVRRAKQKQRKLQ